VYRKAFKGEVQSEVLQEIWKSWGSQCGSMLGPIVAWLEGYVVLRVALGHRAQLARSAGKLLLLLMRDWANLLPDSSDRSETRSAS
jgi:hypothetical protein